MDDKTIIDITNLDAENAAKRVASYSEKLLHHASILSEKEYQKFLLERLEKDNGYVIRKASNFDRYFAVDREMLFKFLEDTQHETMEYLRNAGLRWHFSIQHAAVSSHPTELSRSM